MENRFSRILSKTETLISGIFLIAACVLVFTSVVLRVFWDYSSSIMEEAVRYLIVWCIFIGASLALKNDKHITIDILLKRLPEKIRIGFQTLAFLLGLGLCLFIFFKGVNLVWHSYLISEKSTSAWRMPMFIPKLAVPVGAILISFRFLEKIYLNIRWLRKERT
ncbi:TRAP transporter small permease [Effusibacillus lacus]|uniref:C4-dicarboxylate ABC transporter substrate-binding protein n=1 Tax=Effusibacillus lacus TaxID=1348429 RepID=A0A292YI97_9BACL|nr:TRAP transporter small permease [Effusibacillus lacus]TCS68596.1 TRAP-type C4-dicarboxylate transport system permease small subunit [Effusibacillus lacus]GAX88816.1 C4-dicarboxylate ABC transporter substrate-binding protein [Effusibacillus lacus]